ncbi:MAG: hypothetical protein LBJ89_03925 [Holosporales bacterium]|jgi:hypothetical protein|nr:hypothetical protein [Holosporales bacterium]
MRKIFKNGFLLFVLSFHLSSNARIDVYAFKSNIKTQNGTIETSPALATDPQEVDEAVDSIQQPPKRPNVYVENDDENEGLPPEYSLFWGSLMRQSGYLENLRFSGNFIENTEMDPMRPEFVHRRLDKGLDNISVLLIELYPSNSGRLEANGKHSFANSIRSLNSDERNSALAKLMIAAEVARLWVDGKDAFFEKINFGRINRNIYENREHLVRIRHIIDRIKASEDASDVLSSICELVKQTPVLKHAFDAKLLDSLTKTIGTLNAMMSGRSKLDDVQSHISNYFTNFLTIQVLSIMGEMAQSKTLAGMIKKICNAFVAEAEYGYSTCTTEHIVLAFIAELLEKKDVPAFLQTWRELRCITFQAAYIDGNRSTANARDIIMTKAQDIHQKFGIEFPALPYDDPVSNGFPAFCVIENGKIVKDNNRSGFADCVETSLRHTFTYVLGTENIKNGGNITRIRDRVNAEFNGYPVTRTSDRLDELENFLKLGIGCMNSDHPSVRTSWNSVVSCLNYQNGGLPVAYKEAISPINENEIQPGFINFTKALAAVLGVHYNTDTRIDVIPFLKKLLKCINPARDYEITADSFYDSGDEYYGELLVKLIGEGPFAEFRIDHQDHHGCVWIEPRPKIGFDDYCREREYDYLCGYLYSLNEKQNMYHSIFSYAPFNLSNEKIARAFYFYKRYIKDEKKRKALMTIVLNCMSSMFLDAISQNVASACFLGIGWNFSLNQTIINDIRNLSKNVPQYGDCADCFISLISNHRYIQDGKLSLYLKYIPEFFEILDIDDPNIKSIMVSDAKALKIVSIPTSLEKLAIVGCDTTPIELPEMIRLKNVEIVNSNVVFSKPLLLDSLLISGCYPVYPIDVSNLVTLRKLHIDHSNVIFSKPLRLDYLCINGCNPVDPIDISKLVNLTELDIKNSNVVFSTPLLSLIYLNLNKCNPVNPIDLSMLENLQKLNIKNSNVVFSKPLPLLDDLIIDDCDRAIPLELPELENLSNLSITNSNVLFSRTLHLLASLRINNCNPIDPIDLSNFVNLTSLYISNSNVNFSTIPTLLEKLEIYYARSYSRNIQVDLSNLNKLINVISSRNVEFLNIPQSANITTKTIRRKRLVNVP